jgi:hypothetical protein
MKRSSLVSATNLDTSIRPPLLVSLEDQALAYYFHRHVIPPGEIIEVAQGHEKYLPLMWMQACAGSAFHLSILAISHAVYGRRRQDHTALTTSTALYFKAISIFMRSLQNPVYSCSDQALLATMVLSLYETVS